MINQQLTSGNIKGPERILFEINLEKLEALLIEEDIIDKPSKAFSDLFNLEWRKNIPVIEWKSSQESLVYLFYKINNNSNDIDDGTITEIISKTCLIKGKTLSNQKIANSLRNLYKRYIKNGYQKTGPLQRIDRILRRL